MVRIVSDTPTGNYIMMTWKYQKMEHILLSKTSEWVTMKKFKVHDAGSIGSLGCNYCLRSFYLLQFLPSRPLFLLWIYYTLSLWCAASISVVCFPSTCFFAQISKPRDVNLIRSEMVALGRFGNANAKMASDFQVWESAKTCKVSPSMVLISLAFWHLRLIIQTSLFEVIWLYCHWQCHFNSFHVFFSRWGCWKSHNPLTPRLFCVERRWDMRVWQ